MFITETSYASLKMLNHIQIPPSASTITVSIIDNGSLITGMRGSDYMAPVLPGHETLIGPSYAFLLHHCPTNTRLLFDLSIRIDWKTAYPPPLIKMLAEEGMALHVERDVADMLAEQGIAPSQVEAVVFSHHHFDHTGDMSKFPGSTKVVVGPGYRDEYLPGWPLDPEEMDTTSDLYEGRKVVELEFSASDAKVCSIGGFQAYDYFSDGSLYLLNTPGHTLGHLSVLARTTSTGRESTFIFLGGDIVSSNSVFRPSEGYPLPDQVPISDTDSCPGDRLAKLHRSASYANGGDPQDITRTTPFCLVAGEDHDLEESRRNAEKLALFDGEDDIFTVWAHDMHLTDVVELFPASANGWKEKDWKGRAHWRYLAPCVDAMRNGTGKDAVGQ